MFVIIIIKCKLCILHLSDNIINSKILIDYWLYENELFELINIRQILLSKQLSLLGALVKNCFSYLEPREYRRENPYAAKFLRLGFLGV